jgi:dTDP-4-dehydrorhamnose reductase
MRIIIFGSTGMLGHYVLNVLKDYYDIVCIDRKIFDIESNDWNKLCDLLETHRPNIVINCAGIIPQKVQDNLRKFISVNTLFPHKLSDMSSELNYKFIHITTDCVFNGSKGEYTVGDDHDASTVYGITKSLGEPLNATVIRTSIIGEELDGKKSLLEWVKSNRSGEIRGFTNHVWNGVTCLHLAQFIHKLIETNNWWVGVKHVFSPQPVSKYNLCCYINDVYNLGIRVIPVEDTERKNMTLSGTEKFIQQSIYEQIKDLRNYARQ